MKRLLLILLAILLLTGCTLDTGDTQGSSNLESAAATTTAPVTGGELKVHYIDVGQADCILIQTPGGKNMLIDAGNTAGRNTITTYLKAQGVKRLDVLIGTHPHEDHIGSMEPVINSFDIGDIYMPKAPSSTKTFENVLNAINAKGLKVTTAKAGLIINLDPVLKITMLAPNNNKYEDLNNYSAVVKIVYGSTSFLFTGDAMSISEDEMMAKGLDLKADVLKVGHHGSSYSTSKEFLTAVSPKYAVISVGKDNDYGHPAQDTLNRLTAAGVQIYRTDMSGTIVATSDGKEIAFEKISPVDTLSGGVEAQYKVKSSSGNLSSMEKVKDLLNLRLSNSNIDGAQVQVQDGIMEIKVPINEDQPISLVDQIMQEISATGKFTIREVDESKKDKNGNYLPIDKIVISNANITDVKISTRGGKYNLILNLNNEGKNKFAAATEKDIGKPLAMYIDEKFIEAPTVEAKISGGSIMVTGFETEKLSLCLASIIKYGPLPIDLEISKIKTVTNEN